MNLETLSSRLDRRDEDIQVSSYKFYTNRKNIEKSKNSRRKLGKFPVYKKFSTKRIKRVYSIGKEPMDLGDGISLGASSNIVSARQLLKRSMNKIRVSKRDIGCGNRRIAGRRRRDRTRRKKDSVDYLKDEYNRIFLCNEGNRRSTSLSQQTLTTLHYQPYKCYSDIGDCIGNLDKSDEMSISALEAELLLNKYTSVCSDNFARYFTMYSHERTLPTSSDGKNKNEFKNTNALFGLSPNCDASVNSEYTAGKAAILEWTRRNYGSPDRYYPRIDNRCIAKRRKLPRKVSSIIGYEIDKTDVEIQKEFTDSHEEHQEEHQEERDDHREDHRETYRDRETRRETHRDNYHENDRFRSKTSSNRVSSQQTYHESHSMKSAINKTDKKVPCALCKQILTESVMQDEWVPAETTFADYEEHTVNKIHEHSGSKIDDQSGSKIHELGGNRTQEHSGSKLQHSGSKIQQHSGSKIQEQSGSKIQYSGSKIQQNSGSKIQQNSGSKIQQNSGSKIQQNSGSKIQQNSGSKIQQHSGSKIQQHSGSKIQQHSGSKIQQYNASKIYEQNGSIIQEHSGIRIPEYSDPLGDEASWNSKQKKINQQQITSRHQVRDAFASVTDLTTNHSVLAMPYSQKKDGITSCGDLTYKHNSATSSHSSENDSSDTLTVCDESRPIKIGHHKRSDYISGSSSRTNHCCHRLDIPKHEEYYPSETTRLHRYGTHSKREYCPCQECYNCSKLHSRAGNKDLERYYRIKNIRRPSKTQQSHLILSVSELSASKNFQQRLLGHGSNQFIVKRTSGIYKLSTEQNFQPDASVLEKKTRACETDNYMQNIHQLSKIHISKENQLYKGAGIYDREFMIQMASRSCCECKSTSTKKQKQPKQPKDSSSKSCNCTKKYKKKKKKKTKQTDPCLPPGCNKFCCNCRKKLKRARLDQVRSSGSLVCKHCADRINKGKKPREPKCKQCKRLLYNNCPAPPDATMTDTPPDGTIDTPPSLCSFCDGPDSMMYSNYGVGIGNAGGTNCIGPTCVGTNGGSTRKSDNGNTCNGNENGSNGKACNGIGAYIVGGNGNDGNEKEGNSNTRQDSNIVNCNGGNGNNGRNGNGRTGNGKNSNGRNSNSVPSNNGGGVIVCPTNGGAINAGSMNGGVKNDGEAGVKNGGDEGGRNVSDGGARNVSDGGARNVSDGGARNVSDGGARNVDDGVALSGAEIKDGVTNGDGTNVVCTNGGNTNGGSTNGGGIRGGGTMGGSANGTGANGAGINGGGLIGVNTNGGGANGIMTSGGGVNGAAINSDGTSGAVANSGAMVGGAMNGGVVNSGGYPPPTCNYPGANAGYGPGYTGVLCDHCLKNLMCNQFSYRSSVTAYATGSSREALKPLRNLNNENIKCYVDCDTQMHPMNVEDFEGYEQNEFCSNKEHKKGNSFCTCKETRGTICTSCNKPVFEKKKNVELENKHIRSVYSVETNQYAQFKETRSEDSNQGDNSKFNDAKETNTTPRVQSDKEGETLDLPIERYENKTKRRRPFKSERSNHSDRCVCMTRSSSYENIHRSSRHCRKCHFNSKGENENYNLNSTASVFFKCRHHNSSENFRHKCPFGVVESNDLSKICSCNNVQMVYSATDYMPTDLYPDPKLQPGMECCECEELYDYLKCKYLRGISKDINDPLSCCDTPANTHYYEARKSRPRGIPALKGRAGKISNSMPIDPRLRQTAGIVPNIVRGEYIPGTKDIFTNQDITRDQTNPMYCPCRGPKSRTDPVGACLCPKLDECVYPRIPPAAFIDQTVITQSNLRVSSINQRKKLPDIGSLAHNRPYPLNAEENDTAKGAQLTRAEAGNTDKYINQTVHAQRLMGGSDCADLRCQSDKAISDCHSSDCGSLWLNTDIVNYGYANHQSQSQSQSSCSCSVSSDDKIVYKEFGTGPDPVTSQLHPKEMHTSKTALSESNKKPTTFRDNGVGSANFKESELLIELSEVSADRPCERSKKSSKRNEKKDRKSEGKKNIFTDLLNALTNNCTCSGSKKHGHDASCAYAVKQKPTDVLSTALFGKSKKAKSFSKTHQVSSITTDESFLCSKDNSIFQSHVTVNHISCQCTSISQQSIVLKEQKQNIVNYTDNSARCSEANLENCANHDKDCSKKKSIFSTDYSESDTNTITPDITEIATSETVEVILPPKSKYGEKMYPKKNKRSKEKNLDQKHQKKCDIHLIQSMKKICKSPIRLWSSSMKPDKVEEQIMTMRRLKRDEILKDMPKHLDMIVYTAEGAATPPTDTTAAAPADGDAAAAPANGNGAAANGAAADDKEDACKCIPPIPPCRCNCKKKPVEFKSCKCKPYTGVDDAMGNGNGNGNGNGYGGYGYGGNQGVCNTPKCCCPSNPNSQANQNPRYNPNGYQYYRYNNGPPLGKNGPPNGKNGLLNGKNGNYNGKNGLLSTDGGKCFCNKNGAKKKNDVASGQGRCCICNRPYKSNQNARFAISRTYRTTYAYVYRIPTPTQEFQAEILKEAEYLCSKRQERDMLKSEKTEEAKSTQEDLSRFNINLTTFNNYVGGETNLLNTSISLLDYNVHNDTYVHTYVHKDCKSDIIMSGSTL